MIFEHIGDTITVLLDGLIKGDEKKSRKLFEWISPAIRSNLARRGLRNDDLENVASEVYYKMVQDVRKPLYNHKKLRFRVLVGSCIRDVIVANVRKHDRCLTTVPLVSDVEAKKGWEEDYRVNLMNHGLVALRNRVEELSWLVIMGLRGRPRTNPYSAPFCYTSAPQIDSGSGEPNGCRSRSSINASATHVSGRASTRTNRSTGG